MALGAPYFQAVIKSFEKKYGIPVESLDLRASELVERIRTEQSAGRYLGDAEMVTDDHDRGAAQEWRFHPETAADPQCREPPPAVQDHRIQRAGLRPADGHPDQYQAGQGRRRSDQLERSDRAEMEGQAAVGRHASARQRQHACLRSCKKIWAPSSTKSSPSRSRCSAATCATTRAGSRAGEYPIYITQVFAFASDLKGLPVKVVVPKEGAPYAQMDMAMLKSAPHPNAARLFMQHFLSVDSQLRLRQCLDAAGRAGRGRAGRSGRAAVSPTPS